MVSSSQVVNLKQTIKPLGFKVFLVDLVKIPHKIWNQDIGILKRVKNNHFGQWVGSLRRSHQAPRIIKVLVDYSAHLHLRYKVFKSSKETIHYL